MTSFDDPYSRHIPKTIMMVRQRGIRGEAVGIGVILKRKWHFEEIRSAVCRLFLESKNHIQTSAPSELSAPTTTRKRSGIFTYLRNRFGKRSEIALEVSYGRNSMKQCYSLLQHLRVSMHTAVPFIIAATCQRIDILKHNSSGLNVRTIRIFCIVLGMMNIFRKVSPILCPIEVASMQPEGPSELSGVEIGDQLFFIDGKAIDNFSLKKVNELLCEGEVGDIVNVGILRSQSLPVIGDTNYETNLSEGMNFGTEGSHPYVDSFLSGCPAVQWVHDIKYNSTEHSYQKNNKKDKKIHLSLEIIRDNVLSSKVSSCILSRPSYFQRTAPEKINNSPQFKSEIIDEIMFEGDVVATAKNIKKDMNRDVNRDQSGYGSIGYVSIGEFTQRTLFEVESAIEDIKHQLYILSCNHDIKEKKNSDGRGGRFKDKRSMSNSDIASNDISTNCKDVKNVKIPNYLDALVIDLRGNLGGTLPSALDAASLFLPKGRVLLQMKSIASIDGDSNRDFPGVQNQKNESIVTIEAKRSKIDNEKRKRIFPLKFSSPLKIFKRNKKDRCEKYYSTFDNPDVNTPLLLLVDSQTASASEIFVAALMDNNRATCMGSRTVGKNVAQVRRYFLSLYSTGILTLKDIELSSKKENLIFI